MDAAALDHRVHEPSEDMELANVMQSFEESMKAAKADFEARRSPYARGAGQKIAARELPVAGGLKAWGLLRKSSQAGCTGAACLLGA